MERARRERSGRDRRRGAPARTRAAHDGLRRRDERAAHRRRDARVRPSRGRGGVMRVLILSQYYAPEIGAPQVRLAALARELRMRGHEVEVVTAMPNHLLGRTYDGYRGRLYLRERIDGVVTHRTWIYAATGTGVGRIANYVSFACTSLFGLLRARRADVIFVESPPLFLSLPGWLTACAHRAKLIFNGVDLWPDSVQDLGVMRDGAMLRGARWFEAWTYRRADIVNAVTDGIADSLHGRKHVPSEKLRFLPNGIDVAAFAP